MLFGSNHIDVSMRHRISLNRQTNVCWLFKVLRKGAKDSSLSLRGQPITILFHRRFRDTILHPAYSCSFHKSVPFFPTETPTSGLDTISWTSLSTDRRQWNDFFKSTGWHDQPVESGASRRSTAKGLGFISSMWQNPCRYFLSKSASDRRTAHRVQNKHLFRTLSFSPTRLMILGQKHFSSIQKKSPHKHQFTTPRPFQYAIPSSHFPRIKTFFVEAF